MDAMHDVFVRVLRSEARLVEQAPSSFLYQTATRVCLNHLRTRRRHPETPDEDLLARIAQVDDVEGRSVARAALDQIFSREPVSTGTIAVLLLVDGMTLEEVAGMVGLSVSGVRKRLRTLKARVAELEGY